MSSSSDQHKPKGFARSREEPRHFDKARRTLPLTVRGDSGLREGEVWMLEGRRLDFWSGERLGLGNTYEMRIDLRAQGGSVDLVVKILRVQVGSSSGVEHGYLHHAVFRASSADQARRLESVFWRLNPEHAPEPGDELVPSRRKRQQHTDGSSRPQRHRSGESSRPSVSSMASDGFSTRRLRRGHNSGPNSPPSRHWSNKDPDTRTPRPSIAPPVARPRRGVPQIAPGNPPSVLVRYLTAQSLRADLLLEQGNVYLFMAPTTELRPMQKVMLHMQLPLGHYVTLEARVWESTHRGSALVARGVSPSVMASFRMALASRR